MHELEDDAADAIATIRAAFAGVRRGAITIHEAQAIDDWGGSGEREFARQVDTEETWGEVPDAAIEECQSALNHLDDVSWRFYVPAYMTWSLRHFRHSDAVVSDFTIYTFDLSDDEEVRRAQLARYATLSAEQARAVGRFLRLMARNGDRADDVVATDALNKHWGRFCAEASQ